MTGVLIRKETEGRCPIRQILARFSHKPRKTWGYPKLEEKRKDPPREASEGTWPC